MKSKCDCEVGSPKKGWHLCNRPGVVRVTRLHYDKGIGRACIALTYCERHKHKASVKPDYVESQTITKI